MGSIILRSLLPNFGPLGIALTVSAVVGWCWMFDAYRAALICGAIYIHEAGHSLAARLVGTETTGIVLLPFVGGVVKVEPTKVSGYDFLIAISGPLIGSLPIIFLLPFAVFYNNTFIWESIAFIAFVNLTNLAPIMPLDGGRIVRTLIGSRYPFAMQSFTGAVGATFGLGVLIAVICNVKSVAIFIPFALIACIAAIVQRKKPYEDEPMTDGATRIAALVYLGLIAILALIVGLIGTTGDAIFV